MGVEVDEGGGECVGVPRVNKSSGHVVMSCNGQLTLIML